MKKAFKMLIAGFLIMSPIAISAQNIGDLLNNLGGNNTTSNVLGGLIEGVFTKSDLTVADLVGEYKSEGPAITFKSENFLAKAGGMAGAATIESKLQPYYDKFGLSDMTMTVEEDGKFTMQVKSAKVNGTISKNDSDGTFDFNMTIAGKNIGKFVAYVEKSGSTLKVMFDASKLKDFISAVSKITGNSVASSVGSLLDGYDGLCIGFKLVSVSSSSTNEAISSGVDALKGLLKK